MENIKKKNRKKKSNKKTSELEEEFVAGIEEIEKLSNIDSLSSKLLGYIIISSRPISIEELSEKTGYSIASIYNKLKIMENFSLVKRTKKPGSKKIYFFSDAFDGEFLKRQIKQIEKKLMLTKKIMEQLSRKYKARKLNEEDKKRLEIVENFLSYSKKAEKVVKKTREIIENEFPE